MLTAPGSLRKNRDADTPWSYFRPASSTAPAAAVRPLGPLGRREKLPAGPCRLSVDRVVTALSSLARGGEPVPAGSMRFCVATCTRPARPPEWASKRGAEPAGADPLGSAGAAARLRRTHAARAIVVTKGRPIKLLCSPNPEHFAFVNPAQLNVL